MTTFDGDVDTWILAAVRAGPTSFDDLICHLPGVYPTDVRASLDRLHERAAISDDELQRALSRQPERPGPPRSSVLPVPHPLDFDWRFTADAVDSLIAACTGLGSADDRVVCIGAPSLHERLAAAKPRRSILIDANDEVVTALSSFAPDSAIRARVGCDPLPTLTAGVVVIDPPWYPEHVRLFLWAAARLCADDGIVLLSFPPAGTRPGVAEEREEAVSYANDRSLVAEDPPRRSRLSFAALRTARARRSRLHQSSGGLAQRRSPRLPRPAGSWDGGTTSPRDRRRRVGPHPHVPYARQGSSVLPTRPRCPGEAAPERRRRR